MIDFDIISHFKPEKPTEQEIKGMELLKTGDFEIYSSKLNTICEEAAAVFVRLGVTGMLHAGDMMVGLYTAKGDLVTGSTGTYLHSITGQIPIKYILRYWKDNPTVGINEGDIFYCNDANLGGIHNPDQFAIMPVFFKGEIIAWSVAGAHQPETGATEPGGEPLLAKNRFYEGMKLIPIKIGENYQLKEDLLEMMANMVRTRRMQIIDTRARATGCDRIRIRLQEFAEEVGTDFIQGLFRKMIDTAEEGARKRIAALKDGTYRHAYFMDSIGHTESLLRVCLTLTKKDDRLTFDFEGTSPEHDGCFHGLLHIAMAHAAIYLFGYAFHDFPLSSGIFAPMEFKAPEGCFLNSGENAAISNAPVTNSSVMHTVHVCMTKLLFASGLKDLATVPPGNAGGAYNYAGKNQWGVPFADIAGYPLNSEGGGASYMDDGVDSFGFPWCAWGKAPDAEDIENENPFFHLFQKHMKDHCGHGKYRGGLGTVSAWVVHHVPSVVFLSRTRGFRITPGTALFGGYPNMSPPGIQVTNTNLKQLMKKKNTDIPSNLWELIQDRKIEGEYGVESNTRPPRVLSDGDIFIASSWGGGGYGDALERSPESVMKDVQNESISHWVAQNVYKVVYDQDTLIVDEEATELKRNQEMMERLTRGKRYDDFVAEWSQLKPDESILQNYGSWPDAKKVREIQRV
ncbi:hydantoinase B/oxoprolinase family protein [Bacillus sp. M6-12]|uniref:hydantoinase B/oxoprolinase family protein n=1 Tax=Bacillus sp. M6-12 TaxID=2054166 RepID=UPI0015E06DDC|nr:hydantoinase B/oxoprolinase family protein [Bacillus sp. M6-12]